MCKSGNFSVKQFGRFSVKLDSRLWYPFPALYLLPALIFQYAPAEIRKEGVLLIWEIKLSWLRYSISLQLKQVTDEED